MIFGLIVLALLIGGGAFWYFKNQEKNNTSNKVRSLSCIADLKKGDMLKMSDSFSLPPLLRDQDLTVQAVNSSEYDGDLEIEWVLQGSNDTLIYLSLDEDDSNYIALSIRVKRKDVECLFEEDNFAEIFDDEQATRLKRIGDSDALSGWYTDKYKQTDFGEEGIYYAQYDHRDGGQRPKGEPLRYYALDDSEEEYGISIEVWNSGETDVCLSIYKSARTIVDLLPGS